MPPSACWTCLENPSTASAPPAMTAPWMSVKAAHNVKPANRPITPISPIAEWRLRLAMSNTGPLLPLAASAVMFRVS